MSTAKNLPSCEDECADALNRIRSAATQMELKYGRLAAIARSVLKERDQLRALVKSLEARVAELEGTSE